MKARTRLKLFLEVKERLPQKDFITRKKEQHRKEELKQRNNK
jgi:hypothetical protein